VIHPAPGRPRHVGIIVHAHLDGRAAQSAHPRVLPRYAAIGGRLISATRDILRKTQSTAC